MATPTGVNNRTGRPETVDATFRVDGKTPEFWYPETGKTAPAAYRIAGGRTTVPLRLDPDEAVFVVFRKNRRSLNARTRQTCRSARCGNRRRLGSLVPGRPRRSREADA